MYKYKHVQSQDVARIHGQSARLSYINKATIKQRVSSLTSLKATKQHPQNIWSFSHAKHNMQALQSAFSVPDFATCFAIEGWAKDRSKAWAECCNFQVLHIAIPATQNCSQRTNGPHFQNAIDTKDSCPRR